MWFGLIPEHVLNCDGLLSGNAAVMAAHVLSATKDGLYVSKQQPQDCNYPRFLNVIGQSVLTSPVSGFSSVI